MRDVGVNSVVPLSKSGTNENKSGIFKWREIPLENIQIVKESWDLDGIAGIKLHMGDGLGTENILIGR